MNMPRQPAYRPIAKSSIAPLMAPARCHVAVAHSHDMKLKALAANEIIQDRAGSTSLMRSKGFLPTSAL